MIDTFWIQHGYIGREALAAMNWAPKLGLKVGWGLKPDKSRCCPIGDVDYCQSWLASLLIANFYPPWASAFFHRSIRYHRLPRFEKINRKKPVFIKACDTYKLFEPIILQPDETFPINLINVLTPFTVSDVVQFTQEWRYYVSGGQIVAMGWYLGQDEDEPAPALNLTFPDGWCGAADFGRLSTGEIALVECQEPFSCGWYGDDQAAYLKWLIAGWEYMVRQYSLKS